MLENEDGTEQNQLLDHCGQVRGFLFDTNYMHLPVVAQSHHSLSQWLSEWAAAPPYTQVGAVKMRGMIDGGMMDCGMCDIDTHTNFFSLLHFLNSDMTAQPERN